MHVLSWLPFMVKVIQMILKCSKTKKCKNQPISPHLVPLLYDSLFFIHKVVDLEPCLRSHQLHVYLQTCSLMIDTARTNYDTSVHSLSYTATND